MITKEVLELKVETAPNRSVFFINTFTHKIDGKMFRRGNIIVQSFSVVTEGIDHPQSIDRCGLIVFFEFQLVSHSNIYEGVLNIIDAVRLDWRELVY